MAQLGPVLIQMSGAPGSGKSTMAKLLQQSIGGLIIDHDIIRSTLLEDDDNDHNSMVLPFDQIAKIAYRLQWALVKEMMVQQGAQILIIDSTCNFQQVLDRGRALAHQHGFAYWYVECKVDDIDLLDERLRMRTAPMKSQRTAVESPPEAASSARRGEDARALFRMWIDAPCRPESNAIVVDSTAWSGLEAARDLVLKRIFSDA